MAERRMFTKKVTDDDNFMSLSSSAQALYLHLSMSADDDGFCNQVAISMFKAHASVQDLQALLEKRYIYQFENGVIVIKHWRMANALRKDRYTPTVFTREMAQLDIKENGSYTWLPNGCQMVADCLPQDRIGKDSIGKDSIEKEKKDKKETYVSIIASFTSSPSLTSALTDYVEMRKKMKGFTIRALKLNLKELQKLATDEATQIAIVEQTIANSWKAFYPLKQNATIVQNWEEPTNTKTVAECVEELKDEYNTLLEMAICGCDVKERILNVKLMYKDLTGEELE